MRLLALILLPLQALADPQTYTVDSGELAVMIKYDRGTLMNGHDHILLTRDFTGSATLDLQDPAGCDITMRMKVDSLQVDPGDARSNYGLDGTTSDGDKSSIKKNALSKGQLNAESYPEITFKSTKCGQSGDDLTVTGDLTIRGTSHQITTTVDASTSDGKLSAKGSFKATHADFGFKPYSALLGALKNAEELNFYFNVSGK